MKLVVTYDNFLAGWYYKKGGHFSLSLGLYVLYL